MTNMESLRHLLITQGITHEVRIHAKVETMEDVKKILGTPLDQMVKSLVVKANGKFIIAAIPGNAKLDKRKLASTLGVSKEKLDLLVREDIEAVIGIPPGAIPPFGLNIPVILDTKLAVHDQLWCGFGSNESSLKISYLDLLKVSGARMADISV